MAKKAKGLVKGSEDADLVICLNSKLSMFCQVCGPERFQKVDTFQIIAIHVGQLTN